MDFARIVSMGFFSYATLTAGFLSQDASAASSTHADDRLWYCDPESDPDFAVADIYRDNGQLFARVTQESGDGDEGGEEIVPVTEFKTAQTFEYRQSRTARLANGQRGRTSGLHMNIAVTRREGSLLSADGTLLLDAGPTGTGADENNTVSCKNYKYFEVVKAIDMRAFQDTEVKMDGKTIASVMVPYQGELPTVEAEEGFLCDNLIVWSIERRGERFVTIRLQPEFAIDDGLNVCPARIIQPDGTSALLKLSIFVNN